MPTVHMHAHCPHACPLSTCMPTVHMHGAYAHAQVRGLSADAAMPAPPARNASGASGAVYARMYAEAVDSAGPIIRDGASSGGGGIPKFVNLKGAAAPLDIQNIDTDMIIPKVRVRVCACAHVRVCACARTCMRAGAPCPVHASIACMRIVHTRLCACAREHRMHAHRTHTSVCMCTCACT